MADTSQSGRRKNPGDEKLTPPFDEGQYETHKSTVAVIMGHFMLRHLNRLYQEFDGDLILPIVLGEIAHHNVMRFYSHEDHCLDVQENMERDSDFAKNLEPTNAYSISEATGIPRETVRRKIDKFLKRGWLVKSPRGEVTMSETVSEHFMKDFNKKLLTELLEASECISRLLGSETAHRLLYRRIDLEKAHQACYLQGALDTWLSSRQAQVTTHATTPF